MQTLKRIINRFFQLTGYQILKYQKNERDAKKNTFESFTLNNIFNAFPDWASKFEIDSRTYGGTNDYSTIRISMLNQPELHELIDLEGKSVIEFGPLEGGNTIILERLGARSIAAIEGRKGNYLKCCVIKNLFGLNKSSFYFDDAMNAKVKKYGIHDIAFIAGLMYHLDKPHIFLNNVSEMADNIILSTHYADDESPASDARVETIKYDGKTYRGKLFGEGVCNEAGLQKWSFWPFREDLLNMIEDAGYKKISIINDLTDQGTNYKLIYIVAKK